jgi:hypothetical protein
MGDLLTATIPALVGIFVGFLLSQGVDYFKKRSVIKGYSNVLSLELKKLKEDIPEGLDHVIHEYDQIVAARHGSNTEIIPENQNPSDFLKRWSYRNKYAFLRNNFEKIALLTEDTAASILKIFSCLEEFEEYKQLSISDPDAIVRIGMGDPELLLIGNLRKAQKEIPKVLSLLENE